MTPEQAEQFYEEDEDPKKIFALFDSGEKGVTTAPADVAAFRAASPSAVVGLWRELRQKHLPKVSSGARGRAGQPPAPGWMFPPSGAGAGRGRGLAAAGQDGQVATVIGPLATVCRVVRWLVHRAWKAARLAASRLIRARS